jgi:predicted exporter
MAGAVLMLWDNHLSAIAVGFATIAIGITVDYGIYVVYHLDNAARDRQSAAQIVGRLLLPMATGVLTIIAAFIVLATSPMRGYQQLGIFGAVGVLVSAAFALLVLPLLIPLPKQNDLPPLRFTRWMENFHAWTKRWRPLLLLGVIALTIVTAFGVKRLRFEGDISKLNGITKSTHDDEALIRKTWGDALGVTLVVARGATVDDALAQNDRAAEILARDPGVTDVYSLASICPSAATQSANIRRWKNFWTPARRFVAKKSATNRRRTGISSRRVRAVLEIRRRPTGVAHAGFISRHAARTGVERAHRARRRRQRGQHADQIARPLAGRKIARRAAGHDRARPEKFRRAHRRAREKRHELLCVVDGHRGRADRLFHARLG